MQVVSYEIVEMDFENPEAVFDVLDGEFDTVDIAKRYLNSYYSDTEEYGICRIRKITREVLPSEILKD